MHELSGILASIGGDIHATKVASGWAVTTPDDWGGSDTRIPAVLCLIHSEVSEAMEAFRKDDRDGFAGEMADVLIRLVGLTHGLGIDLGAAAVAKMEANKSRAYRHGGKRL